MGFVKEMKTNTAGKGRRAGCSRKPESFRVQIRYAQPQLRCDVKCLESG